MPVPSSDPEAVSLDEAFKAAMSGPARPKEVPPPPEVDPDAPHGRGEDGAPLAPYGLRKDGKPALTAAGRRAKDAPRIDTSPAVSTLTGKAGKPQAVAEPRDYTGPLTETADGIWVMLSSVASLPILPKGLQAKTGAEAALFKHNQGSLVKALNVAAEKNARARALAEKLAKGDVSWVLTCASLTFPFLVQTALLFKPGEKPEGFPSAEELAAKNKSDLEDHVNAMMMLAELQEAA